MSTLWRDTTRTLDDRLAHAASMTVDPDALAALAAQLRRRGQLEAATYALKRALELRPRDAGLDAAATIYGRAYIASQRRTLTAVEALDEEAATLGVRHRRDADGALRVSASACERLIDDMRQHADALRRRWRGDVRVAMPRGDARLAVLVYARSLLDPGRVVTMDELALLLEAVADELRLNTDHCHLRRYMLSLRLLRRSATGRLYWRNPDCPIRVEDASDPDR